MASIMQGTTPTAIIRIPTKYFLMSDVTAIDMKMENDGNITSYTMRERHLQEVQWKMVTGQFRSIR